jgi:hypothetical protein
MATVRLTDALVRRLEAPANSNRITYDSAVTGFGARVTAAGARSYVLTYVVRGSGRQRRYTIGGCDRWTATDARAEARRLKALIDQGGDPLADIEAERAAPDMADLVARFQEEHFPRLRKLSADDYERLLRNYVLPHFSRHRKASPSPMLMRFTVKSPKPVPRIRPTASWRSCRRCSRLRSAGAGGPTVLVAASSATRSTRVNDI